jgi:2-polyprenyl-6-methoxyphenol hydroxylase-like FAD-dependent oxidoreductase
MKVTIVGAGIGGLTTALSLAAAGIEVVIYDTVPELKVLGLGINLQPNAVRELMELGLGDRLAEYAIETSTLGYFNKHGQCIWKEPRGLAAGYKWPQYSIHRGELQMILLEAVYERIGAENVYLGHHFAAFEQNERGVTTHFVDRGTGAAKGSALSDVLVGADGIHSAVRHQLYPNEGEPVASGRIQWRGCVETEPFLDGRTQVMIGHREQRCILYPMSTRAAKNGRSLVNWLTVLGNQTNYDERETWDRRVTKERFFANFAGWNFDWIKVADMVSATQEIFEYPMADRDPLPQWSFGRVTLMGDAAHAMYPIGSQAGTQAVVDGRVLAKAVAEEGDPADGLRAYEAERLPQMNGVVELNRRYGPEIVMQMAEERAPEGFECIEDVIPHRELEEIAHSFKVAAGFDPKSLNERASFNVNRIAAE